MTTYPVPASVQQNQQLRALARRPQPCGEGIGRGLTCGHFPTFLYCAGWLCAEHATGRGYPLPNQGAAA